MIRDCELLNELRKTTEMGQVGIEAVLKNAEDGAFRLALQDQLAEYQKIETEASELIEELGGRKRNLSPMAKRCAIMASRMQTVRDGSTSAIAGMMIQGNTKGMVKSIRQQRTCVPGDPRVQALSSRLLDTELHNIESMKPYL